MNRQEFLKTLAGGALGAAMGRSLRAQQQLPAPKTVVYKVVKGHEVKLDVYRAQGAARSAANQPGVLWIHGGALINGNRMQVAPPMVLRSFAAGYTVVSIDYRLAPETKVPGMVEDLRDAWAWMRKQGASEFGIDPGRMVVAGGSAGGYLTLMSGCCLEPRPRALVSYYGYGDIDGPWLSEPDDFYRKQPLVSKEEAWAAVGKSVISEAPAKNDRQRFYVNCRQQGIWPYEVSGHDPHTEAKWFDPYCPIRNVTKAYPPTLLIHGTADTDVPYRESKAMAAKLADAGVEHEFITVEGAGHGLSGAKPGDREHASGRAVEWIASHISRNT